MVTSESPFQGSRRGHRSHPIPPAPSSDRGPTRGKTVDERRVGIVMNGVTGRMGLHQHLKRSIVALREQGGLAAADGATIVPEPILVGRNEAKLRAIADRYGLT